MCRPCGMGLHPQIETDLQGVELGRFTLNMVDTILWAGVLNSVKERNSCRPVLTSLCFLTEDAM